MNHHLNYIAGGSWLILVAVAIFVASHAPRIRARVMARNAAQAAWEAQLRADAAERAALRKMYLAHRTDVPISKYLTAIDEYFAAVAASEAAGLDAELEAL